MPECETEGMALSHPLTNSRFWRAEIPARPTRERQESEHLSHLIFLQEILQGSNELTVLSARGRSNNMQLTVGFSIATVRR
jgi:hypothetical protein